MNAKFEGISVQFAVFALPIILHNELLALTLGCIHFRKESRKPPNVKDVSMILGFDELTIRNQFPDDIPGGAVTHQQLV